MKLSVYRSVSLLRLWTPQHLPGRGTEWVIREPLCLAPGRAQAGCWERLLIRDGLAGSRLPSWGRSFHSLFYFPNASWLSTASKRQIFQSTCLGALSKLCPHSGYKGRIVLAATWGLLLPLSTGSRALCFCNWPPFMPASLIIFPFWQTIPPRYKYSTFSQLNTHTHTHTHDFLCNYPILSSPHCTLLHLILSRSSVSSMLLNPSG